MVPLVVRYGHLLCMWKGVDGSYLCILVCWICVELVCMCCCSGCFCCTWCTRVHCFVWLCSFLCCGLLVHRLSILAFPSIRPNLWTCLSHLLHWSCCPGHWITGVFRPCFSTFCCLGDCHLGEQDEYFPCSCCCSPVLFV